MLFTIKVIGPSTCLMVKSTDSWWQSIRCIRNTKTMKISRQSDWATKWIACSDISIMFVFVHDARIQFIHQMNGKFEVILTTEHRRWTIIYFQFFEITQSAQIDLKQFRWDFLSTGIHNSNFLCLNEWIIIITKLERKTFMHSEHFCKQKL